MARKTDIRLRRSNTAGAIPSGSNLNEGELAINTADGALYFKKSDSTVITAHDNTIMHIDSDAGNSGANPKVGILTTNPAKNLHVAGDARISDGNGLIDFNPGYIPINATHSSGYAHIQINGMQFGGNTTSTDEGYMKPADNSRKLAVDSNGFRFYIGGIASSDELIRFDSSGRIGVGTTSPNREIDVHGSIALQNDSYYNGTYDWMFNQDGTNGRLAISYYGSEKVSIKDDGKVGIGTASPAEKLEVSGGVTSNFFAFNTAFTGSPAHSVYAVAPRSGNFGLFTDSTERLTIDGSGNVGIANSSPSAKLHVSGGDILIDNNNSLSFENAAGAQRDILTYNSSNKVRLDNPGGSTVDLNSDTLIVHRHGRIVTGKAGQSWTNGYSRNITIQNITDSTNNGFGVWNAFIGTNLRYDTTNNTFVRASDQGNSNWGNIAAQFFNGAAGNTDPAIDWVTDIPNESVSDASEVDVSGSTLVGLSKMTLTTGGSLGIGTRSPGSILHISNASSPEIRLEDSDATSTFNITAFQNAAGALNFNTRQDNGTFVSTDYQIIKNAAGANIHKWFIGNSEKLRLDASGRLGVGTSSPADELHVDGSGDTTVRITTTSTTAEPKLVFVDGSGDYSSLEKVNRDIKIKAFNTDVAYFTNSGRVGIGTSSPGANLDIESDLPTIRLTETDDSTYSEISQSFGYLTINNDAGNSGSGDAIIFKVDNSEKVRFESGGSVLIGNATNFSDANADDLQVGNTTGAHGISIMSNNSHNGNLFFGDNDNNDAGRVSYNHTNNRMEFYTNRSQKVIINSDGDVGIGDNAPSSKLTVKNGASGNVASFSSGTSTSGDYQGITLHAYHINGVEWYGSEIRSILTASNPSYLNPRLGFFTQDHDTYLPADRTEKMSILDNGRVGIGTTSPFDLLDVAGSGNVGLRIRTSGGGTPQLKFHSAVGVESINSGVGSVRNMTFEVGGSERIRINSSGNVGIGTTSPDATLELSNAFNAPTLRISNESNIVAAGGDLGVIEFYSGDNSNSGDSVQASLSVIQPTTDNVSGEFVFKTSNAVENSGALTERLRIAKDGAITFNNAFTFPTSIGSAGQVLKVPSSGTSLIWASDAGGGSATVVTDTDGDTKIQVEESADEDIIRFDVAGNEFATFAQTSSEHYFRLFRRGTTAKSSFSFDGTGLKTDVDSGYHSLLVQNNGTEQLRVTSGGDVGVGTTQPNYKMHLQIADNTTALSGGSNGNWGGDGLRIQNSSSTVGAMSLIQFRVHTADWHVGSRYVSTSPDKSDFFFKHENTEVLTILNDGKVGIGTTSPSQALSVNGNIYSIGGFVNASAYQLNGTYIVDSSRNLVNIAAITTSGNVTVGGDLTVQGTTTTLNTATLDVEDKNITLNYGSGDTSGSANGAGITIQDAVNSSTDATILWDATNDEFDFSHPIKIAGSLGVTNIVTNKVVKFNGSILDDSNITDDGSTITLGSNTVVNGTTNFNSGVSVNVDSSSTSFGNHQAALRIDNTNTTTNNWAALVFDSNNGSSAEVSARFTDHANNYADLYFANRGSGGYTTKMFISQDGNVGIGTTSPKNQLHVSGGGYFTGFTNPNGSGVAGLEIGYDGSKSVLQSYDRANGAYKPININASSASFTQGSVGIGLGTTAPSFKLHVKETGVNAGAIYVEDGTSWLRVVPNLGGSGFNPMAVAGDIGLIFSNDNDNSTNSSTNGLLIAPHATNASGIKILEDGRVGIGTTTPNSRFTVNTTTTGDGIELQSSEVSIAKLSRSVVSSTVVASLDGVSGRPIHIGGVVNEKIILGNAGGYVGIGTALPTDKLHVVGNINIVSNKIYNGSSNNSAGLELGGNRVNLHGYSGIRFYSSAAGIGSQTERMRIEDDGKVGIGTNAPSQKLDVAGHININTPSGASQSGYALKLNKTNSSSQVQLGAELLASPWASNTNGGNLIIKTANSSGTATNAMAIDGAQNVGIGTTSPSHKLHVNGGALFNTNTGSNPVYITRSGATDQALKLYTDDANVIFESIQDESLDNYGGFIFAMDAGTTHPFFDVRKGTASAGTKLRVDGSGHVGINEANPDSRLHITGTDGGWDKHITIEHDSSDIGKILVDTDGMKFRNMSSGNGFYFRDSANATQMVITSGGNVGMGVGSNPGQKLDVGGIIRSSAVNPQLRIHTSSGTGTGYLVYGDSADDDVGQIYYSHANNEMGFVVNGGSAKMLIDSSGNVGIGTTSPAAGIKLHVNGAVRVDNSEGVATRKIRSGYFSSGQNLTLSSGSSANIIMDTQKVGIGTTSPKAKLQVEEYGIDTSSTTTTATTQVAIHTFPIADFRTARFTIQITNTTDSTYHSTEIIAVHDGTTANITEFGEVHTGSSVEATFDADINSNNFRLLATPASTDSMTFKVVCHSITV